MPQIASVLLCLLGFGVLGAGTSLLVIHMRWSRGTSLAALAVLLPAVCLISIYPAWRLARLLPLDWGHTAWGFFGPYLLTAALLYPVVIAVAAKWLPPPSLKQNGAHPPL